MTDLRAGDIRLMFKAELHLRLREALEAKKRHVELVERLTKLIAEFERELSDRAVGRYDTAEQARRRHEKAEMNRLDRERTP